MFKDRFFATARTLGLDIGTATTLNAQTGLTALVPSTSVAEAVRNVTNALFDGTGPNPNTSTPFGSMVDCDGRTHGDGTINAYDIVTCKEQDGERTHTHSTHVSSTPPPSTPLPNLKRNPRPQPCPHPILTCISPLGALSERPVRAITERHRRKSTPHCPSADGPCRHVRLVARPGPHRIVDCCERR